MFANAFAVGSLVNRSTEQFVGAELPPAGFSSNGPGLFRKVGTDRRLSGQADFFAYPPMKHKLWIVIALSVLLLCTSCERSPESHFFSSFSIRQFVENSKSSAGLTCDTIAGGGGSDFNSMSTIKPGGSRQLDSHKGDSWTCHLKPGAPVDEAALFSILKVDMERTLHDNGATITDRGSSGLANFYFVYKLKDLEGRVELRGTRIGTDYYDVHANLNETRK